MMGSNAPPMMTSEQVQHGQQRQANPQQVHHHSNVIISGDVDQIMEDFINEEQLSNTGNVVVVDGNGDAMHGLQSVQPPFDEAISNCRNLTPPFNENDHHFQRQHITSVGGACPTLSEDMDEPVVPSSPLSTSSSCLVDSIKNYLENNSIMKQQRSQHEDQILQAYHRCSCFRNRNNNEIHNKNSSPPELLLLSGPSGSGKTHLVTSTLNPILQQEDGMLLTGSFDMLQRPEPYRAFVQAFTEFANQVFVTKKTTTTTRTGDEETTADETIEAARRAILEAVGEGASVLTSMIPALERVLGQQSDANAPFENNNDTGQRGQGAISSITYIFRMFVKTVCSSHQQQQHRPVVFLLENLQWADACSLDLLVSLLTDKECQGALFIGTCDNDDNGINDSSSPLAKRLEMLQEQGHVPFTNIATQNLTNEQVVEMFRHVLEDVRHRCDGEEHGLGLLVDLVFAQTQGSLFYLLEFTRWLEEEKFLEFDTNDGRWKWDAEDIALSLRCNRVGDFFIDKLEQLPGPVQQVLKVASCLGSIIDVELLQLVMEVDDVRPLLKEAAKRGMLIMRNCPQEEQETFCFAHDLVQKATYGLILPESKSAFHLMMGRQIWQRLDEAAMEKQIFTMTSQFVLSGCSLLQDRDEKGIVAALCLQAGCKAAKSSTFRVASTYLNFGINLLGSNCWREHYVLSLEIYNAAAEMALCTADFTRMEELLNAVFDNIHNLHDKLQAYATQMYSLAIRDQQPRAIEVGQAVLKDLGESFSERHTQRPHVLREMTRIRMLLRGKTDSMLLRIPPMEDSTKFAVIRILDLMFSSSIIGKPSFASPVILRMMKLTLQHGSSPWTANAFATYGLLCCLQGRLDEGYRFGQLALKLLESSRRREFLPRVHAVFYGACIKRFCRVKQRFSCCCKRSSRSYAGCMSGWKRPIRESLEPLRHAYRVGLETGDVEFGFMNALFLCMNSFEAGVPLPHVEKILRGFCDTMATRKQQPLLRLGMLTLQTIHHLMGLTDNPLSMSGNVIDFGETLDLLAESTNPMVRVGIEFRRTCLAYIFGNLDLVVELTKHWRNRMSRVPPSAVFISACFMDGLVALMMARRLVRERRKNLRIANAQIQRFKKLANHSPHNCLDKLFLLEAERASVLGNNMVALKKFTCANALSVDSGCLWSQAIANERAGEHLAACGDNVMARVFFCRAVEVWERWGATAKAQRLKQVLTSSGDQYGW
jgi:predicted ATPase